MVTTSHQNLLRKINLEPAVVKAIDLDWVGEEYHYPPVGAIPLDERLENKTSSGLITLTAGCLILVGHRLTQTISTDPCLFMAEALLVFVASPKAINRDYATQFPEISSREIDAASAVCRKGSRPFFQNPGFHSKFPPTSSTRTLVFLTSTILGAENRQAFSLWLESALGRLDQIAANPSPSFDGIDAYASDSEWRASVKNNFGPPLPLEALDPQASADPTDLNRAFLEFLRSVNWPANPYLHDRPPSELIKRLETSFD